MKEAGKGEGKTRIMFEYNYGDHKDDRKMIFTTPFIEQQSSEVPVDYEDAASLQSQRSITGMPQRGQFNWQ